MSNWNDNENEELGGGLNEIEQIQAEAIMLDTAFNNSYLILTNQITFSELLGRRFDTGEDAVMAHDPEVGPKKDELLNMLDHYVELEEYERCAKIKQILDQSYSA
jgi:hypothetical protein